jgi:hypothetical protein
VGEPGDAPDDDHRRDGERADEEPDGDRAPGGRRRGGSSEWGLHGERSRHDAILPGAARARLTRIKRSLAGAPGFF